ncbi:2'-5' RNA ligase family protein [Sinomonas halotolerans]|uniref:2'-5' RNA ligase family protein n=1 Tax=Sinomonas halotolerans TaxID=1644133 RepID=A0ABU9X3U6_9MICC
MDGDGPDARHPFVAVMFVEPAPVGERFGKRHWPLHVTLLRFDLAPDAALAAASGAFAHLEPVRAQVGHDADFGFRGRVRVSLVEAVPGLRALHESLLESVGGAGGYIHSTHHTGDGFRPHVTMQGERRVHEGDTLRLDSVSLVDMAPGGDAEWRLPTAEFRAEQEPGSPWQDPPEEPA